MAILFEERAQETDHTVAHIREAMGRVQHPLYRYLITSLLDAITLQIAAVEHAIDEGSEELPLPKRRSDC